MSPEKNPMYALAEHVSGCAVLTRDLIMAEIAHHGTNRAAIPYATDYHDGEWWIHVEVDMPVRSFDVETHDENELTALTNALSRVRRNFHGAPKINTLQRVMARAS